MHRVRTAACALAVLAFAALVGFVAGDWLWGAITGAALTLVTLDAFAPTLYVADAQGLRIHGVLRSRRVAWADVTRVGTEADGAYLSLRRGSRNGRGVTVLLDAPERGAWLKERVAVASTATSALAPHAGAAQGLTAPTDAAHAPATPTLTPSPTPTPTPTHQAPFA